MREGMKCTKLKIAPTNHIYQQHPVNRMLHQTWLDKNKLIQFWSSGLPVYIAVKSKSNMNPRSQKAVDSNIQKMYQMDSCECNISNDVGFVGNTQSFHCCNVITHFATLGT